MTAVVLDGAAEAARIIEETAEEIRRLASDRPPTLAIVVAATPAARRNLGVKQRFAAAAGVRLVLEELPVGVSQEEAEARVETVGADDRVDGLFVQLPLPLEFDHGPVLDRIPVGMDVDGCSSASVGRLVQGRAAFWPAAVDACLAALERHRVAIVGRRAVLLGSGGPVPACLPLLAAALERAGALVCRTSADRPDWVDECRRADLVVSAADTAGLVTAAAVAPGAVVVDAGVTRVGGRVVGDIDLASIVSTAALVVPTPGGLGPLTVAALLAHTVTAARARRQ